MASLAQMRAIFDAGGVGLVLIGMHQHTALALNQLEDDPQPVVVLLQALLEKDPARRFQSPDELLKAIPTIIVAIDAIKSHKYLEI
jgi:hypothetical protein